MEDIRENNYDFENSSITEYEYYNQLDSILEMSWVDELSHSLPLNELTIKSHHSTDINFTNHNLPEDMIIRNVYINKNNKLNISINTTKWLCTDEHKEKYFGGEYTDEIIKYLRLEIEFIDNFKPIKVVRNDNGRLELNIKCINKVTEIKNLDNLFSFMGFSISRFTILDESIDELYIKYDESQVYNKENIQRFQDEKYQNVIDNIRDNSTPIELPSGITSPSKIWMFCQCRHETITSFPEVEINAPKELNVRTMDAYKIPVEKIDDVMMNISNWPDNVSPVIADEDSTAMAIHYGYACSETNTIYIPTQNLFENLVNKNEYMNTYRLDSTDEITKGIGGISEFELFNYN